MLDGDPANTGHQQQVEQAAQIANPSLPPQRVSHLQRWKSLAGDARLLPVTLQYRLFRQIQESGVAAEVTTDEDRCSQSREIVGFERLDDRRVQTEMVGDVTLFGTVAGTDLGEPGAQRFVGRSGGFRR